MLRIADLVIVVSKELYENKKYYNKHTYIVPNGVDYESYNRALLTDKPLPPDIARFPKPIIGYSGLISKRLDLELIQHVASTHPEWSLVLVGTIDNRGCEHELNVLKQMKNVSFLGLKSIKQLPYYVKAFDVCIIPYVINEESLSLSSLKLYDFMATGKPIVTTDFPASREFKDILYIADSNENFIHFIEQALFEPPKGLFSARRRVAYLNTWERRIDLLSGIIQTRLQKAGCGQPPKQAANKLA